jgi:hypothetical protein
MNARSLLLIVLVLGCATAPGGPASDAARAVTAAEEQLAREQTALTALGAEARPTDCPRARTLRDNICTLAEKICALVGRDASVPDGPRRCQDARERCQNARSRVTAACPR